MKSLMVPFLALKVFFDTANKSGIRRIKWALRDNLREIANGVISELTVSELALLKNKSEQG